METNNEIKDLKTKRGAEMFYIPFPLIYIEPNFNIREDMGDLEGLMNNILEIGQQEPIKVKKISTGDNKGMYQVIEGHRRCAAIKMAIEKGKDIESVLAINSKGNEEDAIIEMLSAGIYKKELNDIEIAEGVKRLSMRGYNNSEIGRKIGKSHTYVAQMLVLSSVTKPVKDAVVSGKVKAQDIIKLMKAHNNDEKKVEEVVIGAIQEHFSPQVEETKESETPEGSEEISKESGEKTKEKKQKGVQTLKADVLGVKPLNPVKKLEAAIDIIWKRYEEKKLALKNDKKMHELDFLVEKIRDKEGSIEDVVNALLSLL